MRADFLTRWPLSAAAAAALAAVVLGLWASALAHAQVTTTIVVPKAMAEGTPAGGYLDVFADGELCGRLSFTDPAQQDEDGNPTFSLGATGQPAACSTAGAVISFVNGRGDTLVTTFELVPGTPYELVNLAPEPPRDPAPTPTPSAPVVGTGTSSRSDGGSATTAGAGVLAAVVLGAAAALLRSRRTAAS